MQSIEQRESHLVKAVREFLEHIGAPEIPEPRAIATPRRGMGSALAGFLFGLLRSEPRWCAEARWIDDLAVVHVFLLGSEEVLVEGGVIWGPEDQSKLFTDPCRARMRISPARLVDYSIRLGDARRFGTKQYSCPAGYEPPADESAWLFRFDRRA